MADRLAGPSPATRSNMRPAYDRRTSSVPDVGTARVHRADARHVLDRPVTPQRVAHPGNDVVHRVVDIAVPRQRMPTERRVNRLHQTFGRMPGLRIGIPVIYCVWISAGFVLNDCPDIIRIQFAGGDTILLQDLDRFLDPLLDVARRWAGRWAAARAEAATASSATARTAA